MKPSVIILTFNSADSIGETLSSLGSLSDDIHIVDSGSTDETVDIVGAFEAKVYYHPFVNYGEQRNWAIENLHTKYEWQLHLDADEYVSEGLRSEIMMLPEGTTIDGFFIKRYLRFMRKLLKHNLAPTWHMRLFRAGLGHCEARQYDQHFICSGRTATLKGEVIDDIRLSLSEWTFRHNRWSDAEVRELTNRDSRGQVTPKFGGNIVERKRYLRGFYDRCPRLYRSLGLFVYRYFLKGGFLDGVEGLIFCVLQTLWFRFLIDAKLLEADRGNRAAGDVPPNRRPEIDQLT